MGGRLLQNVSGRRRLRYGHCSKKFKTEQPNARFFSMDLKAIKDSSQDEMVDYFQSRNVTKMPYIELYVGRVSPVTCGAAGTRRFSAQCPQRCG